MAVILSLCSWIGMILGATVLVLLVIPLRIQINGQVSDQEGFDYELRFCWAWGVIGVDKSAGYPMRISVLGLRVLQFSGMQREEKKRKPKDKPKKRFARSVAGTVKNHFPAVVYVLDRMARAAFLKGHLIGCIGLSDPADTANLALFCRMINPRRGRFSISLACEYDEPVVRIAASASATMIIGYLGMVACRLMLQRQTRVMLRSLRYA